MTAITQVEAGVTRAPPRVRHIVAVVAGNAIEVYDFLVYAFFARQIGQAFFPASSPTASLLAALERRRRPRRSRGRVNSSNSELVLLLIRPSVGGQVNRRLKRGRSHRCFETSEAPASGKPTSPICPPSASRIYCGSAR